ncbi:hypothetical protein BGZ58_006507 [Dissophora ornata]|nr:hypothetical protein BGZ58_006507 [Dissophora ornata]
MDLTTDSPFLKEVDDKEFDVILKDIPSLSGNLEMKELDELLDEQRSYEELQDKVFNTPPNTPVRRFLFRVVDSYSRYFPKHSYIPRIEIAIIGTGERRNASMDPTDKMKKCKRADITGNDTRGNQVFLAECSMLYEKDIRKKREDRRKLARSMKDSWDSAAKKLAESHLPHDDLSVFGLQFFDEKLTFLKLDYRAHYRLWQVDTSNLPTQTSNFHERAAICCKTALMFARAVAEEVRQRKELPALSPRDVLSLTRVTDKLTRTTDS